MIEIQGLSRRFGAVLAVSELDLSIARGEIFGFLGPNGAGKTTTLRMLCGLLRPSSGTIRIGGLDLAAAPAAVRRLLAFAPDTPPLYEYLSVREHLGFVASLYGLSAAERDERSRALLPQFGLSAYADQLCKGLSHGTRKKAHLAALLCVAPQVLVLDEPTNGLDPRSTHELKQVLRAARDAGTTVFLSTHVLGVAEAICDRVGILSDGRLLACGTLEELRKSGDRSLEDVFLRVTEASWERSDVAE
ncbi:MAG: ABC transporter ATP-binding protein [Planctomycetes bacterium]|nr:ABC transporter ATP-binding protein [Planctomycetota bacterium]